MAITNVQIIKLLENYLEYFPEEVKYIQPLRSALATACPLTDRNCYPEHITCSIALLDKTGEKVLLAKHRKLERWLYPGGHIEHEDTSLFAAGFRELVEETNISPSTIQAWWAWPQQYPFSIDKHRIPENSVKQEVEHWHWDFRFICQLKQDVLVTPSNELAAIQFVPFKCKLFEK